MSYFSQIAYKDSGNLDSFGRLRVSNPTGLFDAQFTYDLQPLLFEAVTNGTGATVTHDATNRNALLTFASTPTGGKAYMQSYEHFRYQPGKSQQVFITFNMRDGVANVLKFAGYSTGTNGIEFQLNGTTKQVVIYNAGTLGNQTVTQANRNIDKLDGTGKSGLTLDISKVQIFGLDFQALYEGRVRVGFDIGGQLIYCHEFMNANMVVEPYIQTANLPIRCGMTCTGTVSTTMDFQCSTVISEGGNDQNLAYPFSIEGTATAGSGTRTHILSIRPKTTFNSIANRVKFILDEVVGLVTGINSIFYEIVIGQAISGTTTFTDVNTTYSAFEYNTVGTISGSPALVIASGYISASGTSKGQVTNKTVVKLPITLNEAGVVRANGTISLLVTGIGGTSTCRLGMNREEIR